MKRFLAFSLVAMFLMTSISVMPVFAEEVTIENFEPFTLTIAGDGGEAGLNRVIAQTTGFPFKVTADNELVGCLLNGKATYNGTDGAYPAEILFVDVQIKKSLVRTNGMYNLDFTAPDGLPLTGALYTFELTLSPPPEPAVDFPEDSTTFFIAPSQFSLTGNWELTTNGGYDIVYATGSVLGSANAIVVIPEDGTYTVKGLSVDFPNNQQGFRHADIKVGDNDAVQVGTHGQEGYKWQTVGTYEFKKGDEVMVEVCQSSGKWARLAAISFSTDADYVSSDNTT